MIKYPYRRILYDENKKLCRLRLGGISLKDVSVGDVGEVVKPFGEAFIALAAPMVVRQDDGSPEERLLNGIFTERQSLAETLGCSAECFGLGQVSVVMTKVFKIIDSFASFFA